MRKAEKLVEQLIGTENVNEDIVDVLGTSAGTLASIAVTLDRSIINFPRLSEVKTAINMINSAIRVIRNARKNVGSDPRSFR